MRDFYRFRRLGIKIEIRLACVAEKVHGGIDDIGPPIGQEEMMVEIMFRFRQYIGRPDEIGNRVAAHVGQEIGPDAVVYAPSEDVVEIGMGEAGCADTSYCPAVWLEAESIDDASSCVETRSATGDGENEGGWLVCDGLYIIYIELGTQPFAFYGVVAIQGHERAFLKGVLQERFVIPAFPVMQLPYGCRDVVLSIGTKVIHQDLGVVTC